MTLDANEGRTAVTLMRTVIEHSNVKREQYDTPRVSFIRGAHPRRLPPINSVGWVARGARVARPCLWDVCHLGPAARETS